MLAHADVCYRHTHADVCYRHTLLEGVLTIAEAGEVFTCLTGTKVQMLTPVFDGRLRHGGRAHDRDAC
jgi:hypothetical protein